MLLIAEAWVEWGFEIAEAGLQGMGRSCKRPEFSKTSEPRESLSYTTRRPRKAESGLWPGESEHLPSPSNSSSRRGQPERPGSFLEVPQTLSSKHGHARGKNLA